MIETMRQVLQAVLDRLRYQVTTYLPSILAALIILAGAYVTALVARWILNRIFKGIAVDRFLRRSGLAFMIDSSGRLRATRVVAETAYWLILLAGIWLSQYLGRSTLVWAVNEGIPQPRRIAVAVRLLITFVAVVVAAEQLDFARNVFLAAFIILMGGAALAASLALGLAGREAARHYFRDKAARSGESTERSLWNHL